MKLLIQNLIILLVRIAAIWCECDVCHQNSIACHGENIFSLCLYGLPTKDLIRCPDNHVCTADPLICYPLPAAKPSCVPNRKLCGICSENKVYACTNETTIAFCYGKDKPIAGAEVSHCPDDTVCDIKSKKGFCTEKHLVKPSCVTAPNIETITLTTTTTSRTSRKAAQPAANFINLSTLKPSPTPAITTEATTTTTTATTTTIRKIASTSSWATKSFTTSSPRTTSTTNSPKTPITTTPEPNKLNVETSNLNDPKAFCEKTAKTGYFYAGDPTCTTFIICYKKSNGSITGVKKGCKSNKYFPPGARTCTAEKPEVCT